MENNIILSVASKEMKIQTTVKILMGLISEEP